MRGWHSNRKNLEGVRAEGRLRQAGAASAVVSINLGIRNARMWVTPIMNSASKRVAIATSALLAVAWLLLPTSSAMASSPEEDDPGSVAEILSSVDGDRPLATAELEVMESEGVTIAASNTCNSWKNAGAGHSWVTSTDRNCAYIGNAHAVKGYGWQKATGTPSGASVCIQGRGYRFIDPTKPWLSVESYWYSKCGASGSFTVKWQNSASNPQIKHRIFSAPGFGLAFQWR